MRRRDFIGALGSLAAVWPVKVRAQPSAGKIARIGFVGVVDNPIISPGYPAFLDELKKSGFSEGQNLTIEVVKDIRDAKRFFADAADLARSNVDVLVAVGPEIALQAAVAASRTIPIVMWAHQLRSDRTRLCEEPDTAWRQHHRRSFSANGIGGKASGVADPGTPRKNAIGGSLGRAFSRPVCRGGATGEIAAFGRPVAETGESALQFRCCIPEPFRRLSAYASRALQSVFFRFPHAYCRTGDPATAADHVHL